MATRLHRLGTIFSRTDGAIRKGLIKNPPVWINVYRQFPPKYEPKYTTNDPVVDIPEIFYEEDILRAEIHKICSKDQELIDLTDEKTETQSQRLLKTCQQYISNGMSKEDALKKIKESVDSSKTQKSYKAIQKEVKQIIPPKTQTQPAAPATPTTST